MNHADLAWLSWRIYERRSYFETLCNAGGFEVAHWLDRHGTQAALVRALDGSGAALVGRGTQASQLHLRDLWSNLSWPRPTGWQGPGGAHAGYRRHLNMIADLLVLAERVASEVPLKVAGHSMGGAYMSLFAAWFYDHSRRWRLGYGLSELVVFGAPKAMDRQAAAAIKCDKTRYHVEGDFAALWPPAWGLVHIAEPTLLPPRSAFHGPLRRHSPEGYFDAVVTRPAT